MRRRYLLGCIAALGLAWCGADDEKIWSDFVAWYRAQPITDSDPRKSYREHLRRSGVSEAELEERFRIIERIGKEREPELHPFFFDRTYKSAPRFNTEPNALLVEAIKDLTPGRALDVDMGQGRNAVYLASKGWDVTGFDFSGEGVDAAREAAKKAGVRLTALLQRHEDFDFGKAKWDLVVMSYTWVPLRAPYVERIVESLKPGGLLVFEHMMDESGSRGYAPWLARPNRLLQIFSQLRILRYEDVRAPSDWSWRPERIARLVAQK